MNVKKTIKKIVALGAGATMVGATMMGAMAQSQQDMGLEDYPGMWMDDGQFQGKLVVGEDAATSDVLGSIDIAASLQAASTAKETVDVPGAAGKTTLQGDTAEIGEANDMLTINEPIGDVKETITEFDVEALQGGTVSTDEGTTNYNQYLRFKAVNNTGSNELFPTAVVYGQNDAPSEQVSDWLHVAEGDDPEQDAFFEWEIEFEEGLESEIESDGSGNLELNDLEDEVFNIFGTDFVFVDSEVQNNSNNDDVTLEFIAGDVTDSLQEGETKTYTIDGKDYEVTLVFVSNPNGGNVEAKLSVNGELTDAMQDGGTDILSSGLEVGIQEILVSERGGVAEFFLGAQKVQFRDTNANDDSFERRVEITEESIEDAFVRIQGQVVGGGNLAAGEEFEITDMSYRLTADALSGTTNIYVPPEHGIKEFLDEPMGMLSPSFDITYEGFMDVGETPIEIAANGDDEYEVRATNRQGNQYNIAYVETLDDGTFRLGSDNDEDFNFVEDGNFQTAYNAGSGNLNASDFFVDKDDEIVLSNNRNDAWDDQAFSHVVEYQSVDTSQQVLTFEDKAAGSKELTYTLDSVNEVLGTGTLIVAGNSYDVYVANGSVDSNHPVAVDLNADGAVEGDRAKFTTKGGGVIDFGANVNAPQDSANNLNEPSYTEFILHTEGSEFDESNEGGENLRMNVSIASDNDVMMDFMGYNRSGISISGVNSSIDRTTHVVINDQAQATTGRYSEFAFDPVEPDEQDNHEMEMTDYGVSYDLYDPSGDNPEELTLGYPEQQRGAQVFVTAGEVTRTRGSSGGVTTEKVNPIAVGLAVLDVNAPAVGTQNMISIGGPCINRVSANLLGAQYPACGQDAEDLGFQEGQATIKLYEDQNAILVAGQTSQDTLGASYVLADYKDYNLQGDEVQVTVADLDTISVSPVSGSGGSGSGSS